MTGEMWMPEKAHIKDEKYWEERRVGWMGKSGIGDDGVLIYPNYPAYFDLAAALRKYAKVKAEVRSFDVYQGPYVYIHTLGAKVWYGEPFFPDDWAASTWTLDHRYEFTTHEGWDLIEVVKKLKRGKAP